MPWTLFVLRVGNIPSTFTRDDFDKMFTNMGQKGRPKYFEHKRVGEADFATEAQAKWCTKQLYEFYANLNLEFSVRARSRLGFRFSLVFFFRDLSRRRIELGACRNERTRERFISKH